jgi:hypothetical protein
MIQKYKNTKYKTHLAKNYLAWIINQRKTKQYNIEH